MNLAKNKARRPWTTPELQRIDAGSAETMDNVKVKNDGGSPGPNKS
jgi:hypothetical protein